MARSSSAELELGGAAPALEELRRALRLHALTEHQVGGRVAHAQQRVRAVRLDVAVAEHEVGGRVAHLEQRRAAVGHLRVLLLRILLLRVLLLRIAGLHLHLPAPVLIVRALLRCPLSLRALEDVLARARGSAARGDAQRVDPRARRGERQLHVERPARAAACNRTVVEEQRDRHVHAGARITIARPTRREERGDLARVHPHRVVLVGAARRVAEITIRERARRVGAHLVRHPDDLRRLLVDARHRPVAGDPAAAVPLRRDPDRARLRRQFPVTVDPVPLPAGPAPIRLDPHLTVAARGRTTRHHAGRGRRAHDHDAAGRAAHDTAWTDDDRWLLCLPLCHVGGLSVLTRCVLATRSAVLLSRFDEALVAEAIDAHDVTIASFVPTMLHRLLDADVLR
ncbi:MAG: AMP-binding protein, partial [Deltaproteobacteria bacterium]|nr:AMP-binding protein [Deltaproteobacteria bacterium]